MSFKKTLKDIAGREGFKDDKEMLCYYVFQGYRLADFLLHLQYIYSIYHSYDGAYTAYGFLYSDFNKKRKKTEATARENLAEKNRCIGIQCSKEKRKENRIQKIRCCLKVLGYRGLPEAIKNLRRKNLTEKQIAMTLNVSAKTYSRLKREFNIVPRKLNKM